MSMENKAIVRRLYEEVWNKRRVELVDELMSPSHAMHNNHLPDSGIGPEAYKREVARFVTGFPDLRFTVEDMVAENDKVAVSWTISGTHRGEFRGIPPTGKKISVEGITIHHIADGKIMDSYISLDYLGLMQQLGIAPAFGQPKGATAH
ncbi:MAG TPA: ester cyclase [Candidatus Acidoferrum sp.]|nr:ester cyclase [Candidatus Acidoferrum sp.]